MSAKTKTKSASAADAPRWQAVSAQATANEVRSLLVRANVANDEGDITQRDQWLEHVITRLHWIEQLINDVGVGSKGV